MHAEYKEICDRSILSAKACLTAGTHEKAAFMAYHAFESMGGSFCSKKGIRYPQAHAKKLNVFTTATKALPQGLAIANIAVQLASLRNLLLYPSFDAKGSVIAPKDVLTAAQAKKLSDRVRGLRKALASNL